MFQPQDYGSALTLMFVSMVCWGSWANTMKACKGYRFQLFYWDYVIGLLLGALAWGSTLGSMGGSGRPFLDDLMHLDRAHALYAILAGIIFNAANLLLVAAIEIAGLAVAFPVGIGVALVVGAVSSYVISPTGNPVLLFFASDWSSPLSCSTLRHTGCGRRSASPSACAAWSSA